MIHLEKGYPTFVIIGGGAGPSSTEDELLNRTPNVLGITGVHDNGKHSGEIRSAVGVCAPGDLTHRIAVRMRDPLLRQVFMHRWNLQGNNTLNGHRPSNEFMAGMEYITKSHVIAADAIQRMLNPDYYKGWVYPVTDDNIHLVAVLADGSLIKGEDQIDQRETSEPPIKDIYFADSSFDPFCPKPNSQLQEVIPQADLIVLSPSSFWTNTLPILRTPGVSKLIRESGVPIAWFCNAFTNLGETDGYNVMHFAQKLYQELGIKVHYGFVNESNHPIPANYEKEQSFTVKGDLKSCRPFVENLHRLALTELLDIEGKIVVRHNGKIASDLLYEVLEYEKYKKSLKGSVLRYLHLNKPFQPSVKAA